MCGGRGGTFGSVRTSRTHGLSALAVRAWGRRLGRADAGPLGTRDHELRVVDRHGPRRHADLGAPAPDQPGLAQLAEPLRADGRHVPDPAPRPAMAVLLAAPLSEH